MNMGKTLLLSEMRKLIKQNQFSKGKIKGQFGTNTDFTSRPSYHPIGNENITLTPQLFLTYMGLQALKYFNHPELKNRIDWVEIFTKSCLKNNFVRIADPFESPNRDDTINNVAINCRHSALAHTILMDLSISHEQQKEFINYLIDNHVQTSSGGWPESGLYPKDPSIISSVYMIHFLYKYINKNPEDTLNTSIEELILKTLKYLNNHYINGFWYQKEDIDGFWRKKEDEATIRFYPTLYLLAFPIYIFYEGKDCKVIKEYPNLVKRLSKDNLIQLKNEQKIFRTTLRYTINLYFHSFFSKNDRTFFEGYRNTILKDITNNLSELNAHEIFGTCLLIDSINNLEIPDNEYFHIFFEKSIIKGSSLIKRLKKIEFGKKGAGQYHEIILEIFNFLFDNILEYPEKEKRIHNGIKKADIVYANSAKDGFFYNLSQRHEIFCPYIIIECKNYNQDIANPAYDQLSGRFYDNISKFGIITCRKIINKKKALKVLKAITAKREYVLILDDDDITNLINAKIEGNRILDGYLENKMMELLF